MKSDTQTLLKCSHCGDSCKDDSKHLDEKVFCCNGCLMVYQLLIDAKLDAYYQYEDKPGNSQRGIALESYEYLNDKNTVTKLLDFNEGDISKISFLLPQIHCSSCLWLLENIGQLDNGILFSRVNFTSKKVSITFRNSETSLKEIVQLLGKIGYPPKINYNNLEQKGSDLQQDKSLLYKLGLAGFSFANIMLLSFPEYLGFEKASYLFSIGYINIILAIPVFLYSGIDYIKTAISGLRIGHLNIDLPIALGMITLFSRSLYEILSHSGEGYLDSFTGFIFFLLIGRWFQAFTYNALDFERTYKSYFPISATVKKGMEWVSRSIDQIQPGDLLRIRNQELIPADGTLTSGKARIDYSFVTGESDLISKQIGDEIFAGGRHQGASIELTANKGVEQSYLTQLWNEQVFKKDANPTSSKLVASISKYFTYVVLVIAVMTFAFWWYKDSDIMFQSFTAVLIVACPCALALAIPFTYGNILRLLSKNGLFLRNVNTIEAIQDIDYIIFDKTGTLTDNRNLQITYHGKTLNEAQLSFLKSACFHSSHPYSRAIVKKLEMYSDIDIDLYKDVIGYGFEARLNQSNMRVGSSSFIFGNEITRDEKGVFIEIDGKYLGYFKIQIAFRDNIQTIISGLSSKYKLAVLSGDSASNQENIHELFDDDAEIYFNQKPKDKLEKIKDLQSKGYRVMMIGDGLNDAGALKQSDVGIVISDEMNNFSPACDGILEAKKFSTLHSQIYFLKRARYIIYGAFAFAFLYNVVGLYFAVSGQMSPVIAAILMPLSSITVIVYGIVVSWFYYHRIFR